MFFVNQWHMWRNDMRSGLREFDFQLGRGRVTTLGKFSTLLYRAIKHQSRPIWYWSIGGDAVRLGT